MRRDKTVNKTPSNLVSPSILREKHIQARLAVAQAKHVAQKTVNVTMPWGRRSQSSGKGPASLLQIPRQPPRRTVEGSQPSSSEFQVATQEPLHARKDTKHYMLAMDQRTLTSERQVAKTPDYSESDDVDPASDTVSSSEYSTFSRGSPEQSDTPATSPMAANTQSECRSAILQKQPGSSADHPQAAANTDMLTNLEDRLCHDVRITHGSDAADVHGQDLSLGPAFQDIPMPDLGETWFGPPLNSSSPICRMPESRNDEEAGLPDINEYFDFDNGSCAPQVFDGETPGQGGVVGPRPCDPALDDRLQVLIQDTHNRIIFGGPKIARTVRAQTMPPRLGELANFPDVAPPARPQPMVKPLNHGSMARGQTTGTNTGLTIADREVLIDLLREALPQVLQRSRPRDAAAPDNVAGISLAKVKKRPHEPCDGIDRITPKRRRSDALAEQSSHKDVNADKDAGKLSDEEPNAGVQRSQQNTAKEERNKRHTTERVVPIMTRMQSASDDELRLNAQEDFAAHVQAGPHEQHNGLEVASAKRNKANASRAELHDARRSHRIEAFTPLRRPYRTQDVQRSSCNSFERPAAGETSTITDACQPPPQTRDPKFQLANRSAGRLQYTSASNGTIMRGSSQGLPQNNRNWHSCPCCLREFPLRFIVSTHMSRKHGSRQQPEHTCLCCPVAFHSRDQMFEHMEDEHEYQQQRMCDIGKTTVNPEYNCRCCPVAFRSRDDMFQHMQDEHGYQRRRMCDIRKTTAQDRNLVDDNHKHAGPVHVKFDSQGIPRMAEYQFAPRSSACYKSRW